MSLVNDILGYNAAPCVCACPSSRKQVACVSDLYSGRENFAFSPISAPFHYISLLLNAQGQVRWASKECNHILNGSESRALDANYPSIEGQSLLVRD